MMMTRETYRIMRGEGTKRERAPWIVFRHESGHDLVKNIVIVPRRCYVGYAYSRADARDIADSDRRSRRRPELKIVSMRVVDGPGRSPSRQ
jgi:hypothetical protein